VFLLERDSFRRSTIWKLKKLSALECVRENPIPLRRNEAYPALGTGEPGSNACPLTFVGTGRWRRWRRPGPAPALATISYLSGNRLILGFVHATSLSTFEARPVNRKSLRETDSRFAVIRTYSLGGSASAPEKSQLRRVGAGSGGWSSRVIVDSCAPIRQTTGDAI